MPKKKLSQAASAGAAEAKSATSEPAPSATVPPAAESAAPASGGREVKQRQRINWSLTPFAAFRKKSTTPLAVAATKDDLLRALAELPEKKKVEIFHCEFRKVRVKTEFML